MREFSEENKENIFKLLKKMAENIEKESVRL